jgi:hypothetical protein
MHQKSFSLEPKLMQESPACQDRKHLISGWYHDHINAAISRRLGIGTWSERGQGTHHHPQHQNKPPTRLDLQWWQTWKDHILLLGLSASNSMQLLHNSTENSFPPNYHTSAEINAERGFLNMFVSLDYMHYRWKNCEIGWQGEISKQTLKEVHNFGSNWRPISLDMACIFGIPSGNNDINVLD